MDTQENTSSKMKKTSDDTNTFERTSRKAPRVEVKDQNKVDLKSPIGKRSSRALSQQADELTKTGRRDSSTRIDDNSQYNFDTSTPDKSRTPVKIIKDNTETLNSKIKSASSSNIKNTSLPENKTPNGRMSRKSSDAIFKDQKESAVRLLRSQDKKNLYEKLHEELKNYSDTTKNEIVLQGNKRLTGKNLQDFLKENPFEMDELYGKAAEELKRKVSAEEGIEVIAQGDVKYIKHKDIGSALIDIIKDRQIIKEYNITPKLGEGKVVTTYVDKRQNLTPIPTLASKSIINSVERDKLSNVERMAVHLRRLEYSNKLIVKASGKLSDGEVIKLVKTIRLQRWWRSVMRRIRAIKLIQAFFRSYKLRLRWRKAINFFSLRVIEFNFRIKRVFSKRIFLLLRIFYYIKKKHILHVLIKIFRTRILTFFKFFILRINIFMEFLEKKNSIRSILVITDFVNRKVFLRRFWNLWKTRVKQYRSKKAAMKSFFNVAIGVNYMENSSKFKILKLWVLEKLIAIRKISIKWERARKLIEIKLQYYLRITLIFLQRWRVKNNSAKLRIKKLISASMKIEKKNLKNLRKTLIRWMIRTTNQKSMSLAYNRLSKTKEFLFVIRIHYLRRYFLLLVPKMKRKIQILKIRDMTISKIKTIENKLKNRFHIWYKFAKLKKSKEISVWELRKNLESFERLIWAIRLYFWKKYLVFKRLRQNTLIVRRHRAAASLDKTYHSMRRKKILFAFEKLKTHNKVLFTKLRRIVEKKNQNFYIMNRYKIIPTYFKLWRRNGLVKKIEKNVRSIKLLNLTLTKLFTKRIFFFKRLKINTRFSTIKDLFKKRMETEKLLKAKRKTKYFNRWKNNSIKNKFFDVKLRIIRMVCKKTFKFIKRRSLKKYLQLWKRKLYLIRSEYFAGIGICKNYINRFLTRYKEDLESVLLCKRAARIVNKYINIKNYKLKKRLIQLYFNKWNKKIFINHVKNSKNFTRTKIIEFMMEKKETRVLKYFFALWVRHRNPKFSKILYGFKKFNEGHLFLKRVLCKKPFMNFVKNMRVKSILNNFRKRYFNNINNNKIRRLRMSLEKWKSRTKEPEIPTEFLIITKNLWYKNMNQEKLKKTFFTSKIVYQKTKFKILQDLIFVGRIIQKSKTIRVAKIQNNFRNHKRLVKEENEGKKKLCMKTIFINYIASLNSELKKKFLKWSRNSKLASVFIKGRIIMKFMRSYFLPKLKSRKIEKLNNFVDFIEFYQARNYFRKLRKNYRMQLICENFVNRFKMLDKDLNDQKMSNILKRWRAGVELRKKAAHKTINKILTVSRAWRMTKKIKKDSLARKIITTFLADYLKKQKIFFIKWKTYVFFETLNDKAKIIQDFIKTYRQKHITKEKLRGGDLKTKLLNLNELLLNLKKEKFVQQLYLIYYFRILNKLSNLFHEKQRKNKTISLFGKLKEIFIMDKIKLSNFENSGNRNCHMQVNPKIFSFKASRRTKLSKNIANDNTKSSKTKDNNLKIDDKNLYLKILIPNFVKYLKDKIYIRLLTGFNAINTCRSHLNKEKVKTKTENFVIKIEDFLINNEDVKNKREIFKIKKEDFMIKSNNVKTNKEDTKTKKEDIKRKESVFKTRKEDVVKMKVEKEEFKINKENLKITKQEFFFKREDYINESPSVTQNITVNNTIIVSNENRMENTIQKKMANLFMKSFVLKFLRYAIEFNHYAKLCKFIKVIQENKEINRRNNILSILKKWWLVVSIKKFQKKKISQIYKKMNLAFLDMVDDMFGDNPDTIQEYVHQIYNLDKREEIFSSNEKISVKLEKKEKIEKILHDIKLESDKSNLNPSAKKIIPSNTPTQNHQQKLSSRKPSIQENNLDKNKIKQNVSININDNLNNEEITLHNSNKSDTNKSNTKELNDISNKSQKVERNDFSKTLNNYNNNNGGRNFTRRGTEINPNVSRPQIEKRNFLRSNTMKMDK